MLKNFASNTKSVSKKIIEYNSNDLEENDEEEYEPIHIDFIQQKADLENYENAIDFRCSNLQEEDEEDIA